MAQEELRVGVHAQPHVFAPVGSLLELRLEVVEGFGDRWNGAVAILGEEILLAPFPQLH